MTFENEGDEVPGAAPSDVSFVVVEKPHERFMRDGDDLVHTARISLKQALTDCTVDVVRWALRSRVSAAAGAHDARHSTRARRAADAGRADAVH